MNVLITGVAGFIGSHLSEKLLSHGHAVTGIDNFDPFYPREIKQANLLISKQSSNFKFIEADIKNISSVFETEHFDFIVHLAAKAGVRPSIVNPEAYIETNISGTQHLLEWMKKRNFKKLIFASSSSVYGNNRKTPFSESDSVDQPISPYAFTKKACELMNYNYHHLYDISIINLRFFTVYGPRQRPDLAIHKFFDLMTKDLPLQIFGDGNTGRDYTFIDDIVEGINRAVERINLSERKLFEIINLGNSKPVLLKDLVESIETVFGKKAIKKKMPMQEGDVDLTFADISTAKRLLNYDPQIILSEGLLRFKTWYDSK